MKKLLALLLTFWVAVLPAAAQQTKSGLTTEINTNFADNTSGAITASILRTTMADVVNSFQQYASVNAQVGTSYTFLAADYGKLVTFTNAAPVAVTLPVATSFNPYNVFVSNLGAGLVTITPTTSTINGAASFAVTQNQSVWIISDGTNYQVFRGFGSGVVNSGTAGRLAYYPSSAAAVSDIGANGTTGQFLQSAGASAPAWSTATLPSTATGTGTILRADGTNWVATTSTYPATVAQGDVLYGSSANVIGGLTKDTNATRYLSNTGASNAPAWAQVALTTGVSGTLPVGNGGTNCSVASGTCVDNISGFASTGIMSRTGAGTYTFSTLTALMDSGLCSTQGDIIYRGAATWSCLAVGTSGQVLSTNGAGANPSWVTVSGTGTVTSVTQGTGMSFSVSPITTTGTVNIDKASAADLAAGTSNKVVTADIAVAATAPSALTPGATVTPDLNTAYTFTLTPNQNFTLGNPSNITGKTGRSFCIVVTNDATPRTITWGSSYYGPGGSSTLALTASAGAIDQICGLIVTTTQINVSMTKAYSH